MPVFPKPSFPFTFDVKQEITALRAHKAVRKIPDKSAGTLLLATWNLANFGAQERQERHHRLIAEVLGWFDLIAIQETRENLADLRAALKFLPGCRTVFTDPAGNDERLVYVFDAAKVATQELVGELALDPVDLHRIKLPGNPQQFEGFDRNPFIQSFACGKFRFTLGNAHLYFGDDSPEKMQRRQLEAFVLARWAKQQSESEHAYNDNVIVLGDFNLPVMAPDDPIYSMLIKQGLQPTEHSSQIGTTLRSEGAQTAKTIHQYDQIAFFPKTNAHYTKTTGVFDYDSAIFAKLWEQVNKNLPKFNSYLRYYISDHRPLWAKFRC
jgi:endonuclease/exonuclease/phosphatase family metal-dependent hydrolase